MPSKKPSVSPLKMTLRSRGGSQDIQMESKLEVAKEESKRRVRKTAKQEAVEETLYNKPAKEQPEEKVSDENLRLAPTMCVEHRKRERKEGHRDVKVARIVGVVTDEKKKVVHKRKDKTCDAPKESQTKVQEAVIGSKESKKVEENGMKCRAAKGSRWDPELRTDATSVELQTDEKFETFSTEDWSVIEGMRARAERIFDVKLAVCLEERSKAAKITISGATKETCLLCKEYLFALTRPGCTTVFPYPLKKHNFLTKDAVHEKLERDSQAFLIFRHIGEVEIYGLDSLSVALAMSLLENVLESHHTTDSEAPSVSENARPEKENSLKHQKSSRRSSLLLDVELKNWMNSSEEGVYKKTNEAVRRSILSVVKDDSREVRMEAMMAQGTPLRIASPALNSGGLKLLSEAYMSILDDSVAPFSPSVFDDSPTASLGLESVKENICNGPDFNSCYLLDKKEVQQIQVEAETVLKEIENIQTVAETVLKEIGNTAVKTETKQSEITDSFTADKTKQDRKSLVTAAETKEREVTHECIIAGDSKTRIRSIVIVSSDSESEVQKDQHDRIETTSTTIERINRRVYVHDSSGLSCEVIQCSGSKNPRQCQRSEPVINLPSAQLHETRKVRSLTSDNQTRSSTTKISRFDTGPFPKPLAVKSDPLRPVQLPQNPPAANLNPVAPAIVHPLHSVAVLPQTSLLASGGRLRYVVIDGSNVAMAHGKHQVFSCSGIEICIKYFLQRGHLENQITAFVPQSRLCRPGPCHKPIVGQHLLQRLADKGLVVFTPARKVPGRNIVCYDDRYVLRLAAHTNGIIVTNDNYRDLWQERKEWREIIENRLLPYSFVNDLFMPPDDPLGRNGPDLNQFLSDQPQPTLVQPRPNPGQWNRNANLQNSCISTNANLPSGNQWYRNH